MSTSDGHCWFCAGPLWDDEEEESCPYCGIELDGDYNFDGPGNPYDDEGDLAYSDVARGEEAAPPVPATRDNPAYPPRGGHL